MRLAYGESVGSKVFATVELGWEELLTKFKYPNVENVRVADYAELSDKEKKEMKDGSCYILGKLRDGHRSKDDILELDAVVLDIDHGEPGLAERLPKLLPYKGLYHSTFSSTPTAPRLRVVLPLKRSVSPGEYPAVAAQLGKLVGEKYVDPASYRPTQVMYFPHILFDAEYVFATFGENLVDPDVLLQQALAEAMEEAGTSKVKAGALQDKSYVKPAHQRAFNLAYSLPEAIKLFLADIYGPTDNPERYTYSKGHAPKGLWVQEGLAFSFDSTDSARTGHKLDAYSLVKIHCFGKGKGAELQMRKWVLKDEKVHAELAKLSQEERAEQGIAGLLEKDLYGRTLASYQNVETIFLQDPQLAGLAYDELSRTYCCRQPLLGRSKPGTLTSQDDANIRVYIGKEYGIVAPKIIEDVKLKLCYDNRFHPVQEYLQSLKWDGVPRLGNLLVDYLGAQATEYVQRITKMCMVAAVTRTFEPGTKFDHILIVQGPSGIGKSTLWHKLGQQWYSAALDGKDINDKKAAEKLQGILIMEWEELHGREKVSFDTLKAFTTCDDDKYRELYDRPVTSHPRQGIIVGTTNAKEAIIIDEDGNRRFVVVRTYGHAAKDPRFMTQSDIDQYWAEAYHYYLEQSVPIYEDEKLKQMAKEEREVFVEHDPQLEILEQYLCHISKPCFISNIELTMTVFGKTTKDITPADTRKTSSLMEKVTVINFVKKKKKIKGVSTLGYEFVPLAVA